MMTIPQQNIETQMNSRKTCSMLAPRRPQDERDRRRVLRRRGHVPDGEGRATRNTMPMAPEATTERIIALGTT